MPRWPVATASFFAHLPQKQCSAAVSGRQFRRFANLRQPLSWRAAGRAQPRAGPEGPTARARWGAAGPARAATVPAVRWRRKSLLTKATDTWNWAAT